MSDKPTLEMQAGVARHLAATAPANLKPIAEEMVKTMAFCAANADVLRAVAIFKRKCPMFSEVIATWPGTEIADIRRTIPAPDEVDIYGGDDLGQ